MFLGASQAGYFRRPGTLVLACIALGIALRVAAAWAFPGFYTGDDVEIVESAFRFAGFFDYSPWEIRNQFLPQHVLGPLLTALAPLHGAAPFFQVFALRLFFALLGGGLTVWWTYRLARHLFPQEGLAQLAALLIATHPLALAFGATTLPRVVSTALILGSVLLVIRPRAPLRHHRLAGALLAAAFACRYSEVIFLPALLAVAALHSARDRRRALAAVALGFGGALLLLVGVEDWLAWGEPFASLREFARYTLVEKQSSAAVASQPLGWYGKRVLFWLPLSLVPPLFWVPWRTRAARELLLLIALPVLLLSLVHHKDLRYLHGVFPFLAVLAASGLWRLSRHAKWGKVAATALVAVTVLVGLSRSLSILSRNSNAAVRSARLLSLEPDIRTVGLSQVWAYGGRIELRDKIQIVELGMPPTAAGLQADGPELDAIALYEEAIREDPKLIRTLHDLGFSKWRSLSPRAGKSVVLWRRIDPPSEEQP